MMRTPMSQPKMPRSNDPGASELARAAAAFDAELRRYDELVAQASKIRLDSEKNLERAAKVINDAGAVQQRIVESVQVLSAAIQAASQRQIRTAEIMSERADEVRRRTEVFAGLMQKFAVLGEAAKTVNDLLVLVSEKKRELKPGETHPELAAQLAEVNGQLGQLVEGAQALAKEARAEDMTDVEHQSDVLRQQVTAARNKLTLLEQTLTRAPSKTNGSAS
jgi:myosin heavy subunit